MAKLNRENIAICILTCSTYEEAAEKAGVSKSTLYRLRREPEFQEVINQVRNSIFQETMHKAQGYCMESLEVLRSIMKDYTATDSSRVSAARTILELGLNSAEQEMIIRKIEELERRMLDD
jgi:hypothetical protein